MVRIGISNKNGEFKPGMSAYVTIKNRESKALTLPADALIRNERNSIIWLQTRKNSYKPMIVETGKEGNEQIEIIKALKAGDVVVTGGAYLLNSEYILKKGTTPGHKMSQM